MEEHKIIVISPTGKHLGLIKGYDVYSLEGRRIFKAKPETTLYEIIKFLLYDKVIR